MFLRWKSKVRVIARETLSEVTQNGHRRRGRLNVANIFIKTVKFASRTNGKSREGRITTKS